eukprot:TRINITY_DN12501_c0_g1_i1.p1 TRINITY_DN12501_c0_g1~~TRINITY_DN12501_c0_g1_i1.p1  ORF type:complete len:222 (+),score=73.77 TRINITY_DN12501_c0_g1_i1:42-707(+)
MTKSDDFKKVTARTYKNQATFFLNAFWAEHHGEAENIWNFVQKFIKLDIENGKEGKDLDEFNAHRFLEQNGETLTIVKLREILRETDLDFNKRFSLIEYLLYRYKQNVKELLSRPQGTNEDLIKAQEALDTVNNEIARIEKKKSELEEKIANASGVTAMKAKSELAVLLSADNTELNRILLTAEAAIRKAQKQGSTAAQGALWWIDRELQEAKKYKPKSKQ